MTFRHKETGEKLQYTEDCGGHRICPHGQHVAYADECNDCMREYE